MKANPLTPRQRQVLQAVIDAPNYSHAFRAHKLGMSEHTFRSHLRHIYRLLGVHSLTGALVAAMTQGLVQVRVTGQDPSPHVQRLTTPRRHQVLRSLTTQPELSLTQRAHWLDMSPHTLDNHLRTIYEILDVNNLNAALILAVQLGLITTEPVVPARRLAA